MESPPVIHTHRYREVDGFDYESNDCTVIVFQVAFGVTYKQAHALIKFAGRKRGDGFQLGTLLDILHEQEYVLQGKVVTRWENKWGKKYRISDFLRDHPQGTYIVGVRAHVMCIKDGVIYDSNEGKAIKNDHCIVYFHEIQDKI